MNAIVPASTQTQGNSNPLAPQSFDQAIRLAEMMAKGKLVPSHLQSSPADCLLVVEQAMRWGMSPFAVAQCTSVIKTKLMFEGKLVAAAIESSGAIIGNMDYTFSGSGAERTITVSATRRGETTPRTVEVKLKDAKTDNGMWTKQPDQQLVYHGARVWGRRWTPGVVLGVYSREEFGADGVPVDTFAGQTIDGAAEPQTRETVNASVPLRDAPEPTPTWATTLGNRLLAEKNGPAWLTLLLAELPTAPTREDAEAAAALYSVRETLKSAPPRICADIEAALQAAVARFDAPTTTGASDWPGPDVPPDDAAAAALGRVEA